MESFFLSNPSFDFALEIFNNCYSSNL